MIHHRYVVGFRSPKYVVHRGGEDRPVAYLDTRPEALRWIAVQMLTDLILHNLADWDDDVQDTLEEVLVNVFRLNLDETVDPTDPEGEWMKTEDYVLSLFPYAFRRVADQLEEEFKAKGLSLDPERPLARWLKSV